MLDLLDRPTHPELVERRRPQPPLPTGTNARLYSSTRVPDLFAAMLDEVDYPMLLVADDITLLYANKAARRRLNEAGCLQLQGHELRCAADPMPLRRAVTAACTRGLRALIYLKDVRGAMVAVAVVPVPDGNGAHVSLLMLARPGLCETLSVDAYARNSGLTASEGSILAALCRGRSALDIARERGVALSTVRSQIGSLRVKTGCRTIGEMVRKMGELPPLVNVLRHACG